MRHIGFFLSIVAVLFSPGCGDDDPVSSLTQQEIEGPAAKLTTSSTRAGGYPGAYMLKMISRAGYDATSLDDLEEFAALFTEDAVMDFVPAPPPTQGREAARLFRASLLQGFPDLRITPQSIRVSGTVLVSQFTVGGTQLGEWNGIPPTGNEAHVAALDIVEFEGSQYEKVTTYLDFAGLLMQLGVLPSSELPPLSPSVELPDAEPTELSPVQGARELVRRWNTHDISLYAQLIRPDAAKEETSHG